MTPGPDDMVPEESFVPFPTFEEGNGFFKTFMKWFGLAPAREAM